MLLQQIELLLALYWSPVKAASRIMDEPFIADCITRVSRSRRIVNGHLTA